MILSFEEYCNNEWTTDFDIVNESMSISNDVAEETQKILDLINSLLKGTKNIKEKDCLRWWEVFLLCFGREV